VATNRVADILVDLVPMEPPILANHLLADAERDLLAMAEQELRSAVNKYQRLIAGATGPIAREGLETSQLAIEAAERELWHLRAELLGWSRPAWAPRASLIADWFSTEDSAYDELEGRALVVAHATTGPNQMDLMDESPNGTARQ